MDSTPPGSVKLDLHGLTTSEALERVEWWLEAKRKVRRGTRCLNRMLSQNSEILGTAPRNSKAHD